MSDSGLAQILEAALFAAGKPLTVAQLSALFEEHERPDRDDIRTALAAITDSCEGRGYELIEVASGFRFQVREQYSPWVSRLWQERPQKYSRALLETLALIAYRQPITRGEIEEIRGVAVSTNIIRTLHERDWIRVVGHRDVPGRPAMYATTRQFLDYFNLKSLDQLPALADIRDLDTLNAELGFSEPLPGSEPSPEAAAEAANTGDYDGDDAGDTQSGDSPDPAPSPAATMEAAETEAGDAGTEAPAPDPAASMESADLDAGDAAEAPVQEDVAGEDPEHDAPTELDADGSDSEAGGAGEATAALKAVDPGAAPLEHAPADDTAADTQAADSAAGRDHGAA